MKIVCEISGGADSMYATLLAKEKYNNSEFFGIMINYGQLTFPIEFQKAQEFCKNENIDLKVVTIDNLFESGTIKGEEKKDINGIAKIYTPLRNLVIGSCALSYAEGLEAEVVIVGSKGLNVDNNPYSFKDSVLPFYTLLNSVINYASYNSKLHIDPILMTGRNHKMGKKEVYEGLLKRGYNWNSFWNCFNNGLEDCFKCNNCIEKYEIKKGMENESK